MSLLFRPLYVLSSSALVGWALSWGGGEPQGRVPIEASARHLTEVRPVRLPLLREALAPVGETYVLPERVQPERMLVAALQEIERRVPETMFRREGDLLHLHVGDHRTSLPMRTVVDLLQLERALETVAGVLLSHLDPEDVDADGPRQPLQVALELAMASGALSTLDPHTTLLPPDESRRMEVENRGEFGGLGIQITLDDERLLVEEALPGQPAALAGVRSGDHVRRIDGQSTINLTLDETVELLRGPVGAPVALEIVRDGEDKPLEVVVERANIKILEVQAWTMPGGIALVRLPSFHATAAADLSAALRRVSREEGGLRGVVLDLRDNPGGYLTQAVEVADLFLPSGEIVATRGPRDMRPRVELARGPGTFEDVPMAVLVNAWSASASEIVAGALRAHERAVVLGERTFGKGSVQNLHGLPHEARLKLTIAHYLTPGARSIQSVGIPADVELVPHTVGWRELDDGREADASLYDRERVRREVDLDAHLESSAVTHEDPVYQVRWWRRWSDLGARHASQPDPSQDGELRFALDLLQSTPSARRADMLAAAGPLVDRWRREQDLATAKAFSDIGVDWRDGPSPSRVAVDATLQLPEGGLVAGREQDITVSVTNRSEAPIHRGVVVVQDHELLDGLEFVLGRVEPGQTTTWTRTVYIESGHPAEIAPARLSLRDASGGEIAAAGTSVKVQAQPLPRLAWSWALAPDEDGVVDEGDVVRLVVTVENVGDGPATAATARIRNRSGRALDILTGTVRAGTWRDGTSADTAACTPVSPGWWAGRPVGTDDPDHPRVQARLAPTWPEGCRPVLAPGELWTGALEVQVREPFSGNYHLDLSLQEDEAFDWATVVRQGFVEHFTHEEPITFALGETARASTRREPPRIQVSREPPSETAAERVTLSGRVVDDHGIDWVTVFVDGDKVGLEDVTTGAPVASVPFTADVPLAQGANTVSIVAQDAEGWTSTASRVVWRQAQTWHAQMDPAALP